MKGLFLCLLLYAIPLCAQLPENSQQVENQVESLTNNLDETTNLSFIAERLQDLISNPIPINFATVEELSEIPFLDVFKIYNLIQYRNATGGIYTAYELLQIKGFDFNLIQKLLPFLNFQNELNQPIIEWENIKKYSRNSIVTRYWRDLEMRKGYSLKAQEGYLGAPDNYYLRFSSQYRDILSVGLNLQQDAGESFSNGQSKTAVDFVSVHIALKNYGPLKSLILGDFHTEFGQGLSLWSSFARGKALLSPDIKRYARGFRPNSGMEENRFFRGIAGTYNWKNIDLSLFISSKRIDANINDASNGIDEFEVSSILSTGLHRTLSELEDRRNLRISSWGGNLKYSGKQINVGVSTYKIHFSTPLTAPSAIHEKFELQGVSIENMALDVDYIFKSLNLFGEFALSQNHGYAGLIGAQSQPSDELRLNGLFRYFSTNYQTFYASPFSEKGVSGEKGFYLGLHWNASKIVTWNTFLDIFEFSWPTFKSDFPPLGYDIATQVNFQLNRFVSLSFRYLKGVEQVNSSSGEVLTNLEFEKRNRKRLQLNFLASKTIQLNSRIEWTNHNSESKGFVVFQDIRYHSPRFPIRYSFRFAFIDTDSYDSRIYAYENDVLYSFSIPAYYGKASRFYGVVQYQVTDDIQLEAKFSRTKFQDRDKISNGLQEINGDQLSQVKIQMRIEF